MRRALLWGLAALLCAGAGGETKTGEAPPSETETASAIFAGGCFWCVEHAFDEVEGVVSTTSGFTGGTEPDPDYDEVSSGGTGHVEAVRVVYRPDVVRYEELLDVFWHNIDPLDDGGQFCDRGAQYRSAIFVADDAQREAAEASKRALEASGRFERPIVTPIRPAQTFYPAAEYHQDYHHKNPIRYRFYRTGCGRDRRLQALWGSSD